MESCKQGFLFVELKNPKTAKTFKQIFIEQQLTTNSESN